MQNLNNQSGSRSDSSEIREIILSTFATSLKAQFAAVQRLRAGASPPHVPELPSTKRKRIKGRPQIDMAYEILAKAGRPLHISLILKQIQTQFGVSVDRESLVSALTKRVARKDRFQRTGPNTFALLP